MQGMDLERLEKVAEGLALVFYVLTLTALVTGLAGSVGSAFVVFVLGACAHVGRAGLEEFVERRRGREGRLSVVAPTGPAPGVSRAGSGAPARAAARDLARAARAGR